MVGSGISSNTEVASQYSAQIRQNLGDYCSLNLDSIAGNAEVSGSMVHDNLNAPIAESMQSWLMLLESDASDIEATSAAFDSADVVLAHGLLGMG